MKKIKLPKVILFSILLNILVVMLIFILKNKIPPEVPLFYGRPQTEKQLASSLMLSFPPLLSLAFCIINLLISKLIKDEFPQKVLMGISILVTVLSTITVIKIITLVGNI